MKSPLRNPAKTDDTVGLVTLRIIWLMGAASAFRIRRIGNIRIDEHNVVEGDILLECRRISEVRGGGFGIFQVLNRV